MSVFVGAALPVGIITKSDDRLNTSIFKADVEFNPAPTNFYTPWWPGSGFVISDSTVDTIIEADWWDQPDLTQGRNSRFRVVGVTRDVYGSVIVSVTVKLYRTSDDQMVSTTTSDANTGYFVVSTPYYPDAHYLIAYKTGTPDLQGTSVNTLIGA